MTMSGSSCPSSPRSRASRSWAAPTPSARCARGCAGSTASRRSSSGPASSSTGSRRTPSSSAPRTQAASRSWRPRRRGACTRSSRSPWRRPRRERAAWGPPPGATRPGSWSIGPSPWNPSVVRALELARSGAIGHIFHARIHMAHQGPKEAGCSPVFLALALRSEAERRGRARGLLRLRGGGDGRALGPAPAGPGRRAAPWSSPASRWTTTRWSSGSGRSARCCPRPPGPRTRISTTCCSWASAGTLETVRGKLIHTHTKPGEYSHWGADRLNRKEVRLAPLPAGRRNGPEHFVHCAPERPSLRGPLPRRDGPARPGDPLRGPALGAHGAEDQAGARRALIQGAGPEELGREGPGEPSPGPAAPAAAEPGRVGGAAAATGPEEPLLLIGHLPGSSDPGPSSPDSGRVRSPGGSPGRRAAGAPGRRRTRTRRGPAGPGRGGAGGEASSS